MVLCRSGLGEKTRDRTKDHRNNPIANLGGEASVSVEQITPEKVLGGALPNRRDSCEDPGCEQANDQNVGTFHEQYWIIPFCRVAPSLAPHQRF